MYSLHCHIQNSVGSPDLDCSKSAWVKWRESTLVLAHEHVMKAEAVSAPHEIWSLPIDTLFQPMCYISVTCVL